MKLKNIIRATENFSQKLDQKYVQELKDDFRSFPMDKMISSERIVLRTNHLDKTEGLSTTAQERMLGDNDLVDINYLSRGLTASKSVCRILLRNGNMKKIGSATGFKISPNLLITNRHVLETVELAQNAIAEFDYQLDDLGNPTPTTRFEFSPADFFVYNKDLDYAIVAIKSIPIFGHKKLSDFDYLRMNPEVGKINKDEFATIIQHPNGDMKQIALRENKVIKEIKDEDLSIWYYSDTARGSSGGVVLNDSWQVVALHFSGEPEKDENGNWLLKDGSIATDDDDDGDVNWIANKGIRVSKIVKDFIKQTESNKTKYSEEFLKACFNEQHDLINEKPKNNEEVILDNEDYSSIKDQDQIMPIEEGLIYEKDIQLPKIRVSFKLLDNENNLQIKGDPSVNGDAIEAVKEPFRERDYSNRKGYDKKFLGFEVPLPKVYSSAKLSKLEDGNIYIPYHKFTVVNNKERRLALFTASNINASPEAKEPEQKPKGSYNRKPLGGLNENDREKWFIDPRLPLDEQLSDGFYNKDRRAFDKGHLVRREDVAWGFSYYDVRRSNGDTYHITNCSPQVKEFNQSRRGGIWGKLENDILRLAKYKKLCVFSGPLLMNDDPIFKGKNNRKDVEIRIPKAYWKIITALSDNNELMSFAFLLTQDLSRVEFEFKIFDEWTPYMISIEELENITKNIIFPREIKEADQLEMDYGKQILVENELDVFNKS